MPQYHLTASASSTTADTQRAVRGLITAVYVTFASGTPNTAVVTLTERDNMARTLFSLTGTLGAPAAFYPAGSQVNTAGTSVGAYTPFNVDGEILRLTVSSISPGSVNMIVQTLA